MTLSLHHSANSWDRTLPKPSALLLGGIDDASSLRSTSLLQHHINQDQLLNGTSGSLEGNGRRSTVAYIPVTSIPERSVANAEPGGLSVVYPDSKEFPTWKRTSSVMSTEGTSRSSSPTSNSPVEGSNQLCLCQKAPRIPRPRNAFILYRQHHHAAVVAQHPGLANPEISKIIGEQWRQLSEKAKEEWKALAEDEKVRHSQQFPGYRYRPRRNGKTGTQSSVSGPSSTVLELPENCDKCGGKPINTPATPFTPASAANLAASGSVMMPQMSARMAPQQIISPPHSARLRQYPDPYGRPIPPPHDLRFQYASAQPRPVQQLEGPEAKKRRFNGDAVYGPSRPLYPETYQRSPHERTMSDAIAAGQYHRPNMGPPARTGYAVQMPANRAPHPPQHRRDPSLTLPPLKTPLSQQGLMYSSSGSQSQKSGVEAMIMSIPVLNKVKILSQIAPYVAAPGPASPPHEVRGAVIAVEGMDPASVYNMTNTLAEQLEKDGKFAVRIFGGPDPYAILSSSNRASSGNGEHLSAAGFLDLISQWHKISKEMQEYITKRPSLGDSPDDITMQDADHPTTTHFTLTGVSNRADVPQPKSPVSAVSPKTITQTADLSLKSPLAASQPKQLPFERSSVSPTTQHKPRIPASAIAKAESQSSARSEPESESRPRSGSTTPLVATSQTRTQPPPTANWNENAIPIAIVPHYQLTTVDTSSIAMPINDAYSPHSHWQWLATLWRGCIGPDATIVIQGGDLAEDGSDISPNMIGGSGPGRVPSQASIAPPPTLPALVHPHSQTHQHQAVSNAGPARQPQHAQQQQTQGQTQPQAQTQIQAQPRQQHQDVEVRLQDSRAVVVRAPNSVKGRSDWEGSEWWEKAKRRVGFEVEEFLRR